MARKESSEEKGIQKRRQALREAMDECYRKNIPVTEPLLVKLMAQRGYQMTHGMMQKDMTVINKENTFLADLAESNYSAYLEGVKEDLDLMEYEICSLYNTNLVKTRYKKKFVKGQEITVKETIENDWRVKANLLKQFLGVQKSRMDMLKGKNVDVRVDMLARKLRQVKAEHTDLKGQLAAYENEKAAGAALGRAR